MIEIGTTCAYRFFKGDNNIISVHHKSKKISRHTLFDFYKTSLVGNNNDAIFTYLVKKYIGSRWDAAFSWAGWVKKRLVSTIDYRMIAMLFNADLAINNLYDSPAIAKYKITHLIKDGVIPETERYNWLSNIKYPVTLFPKPESVTMEVTNLYHYRAAAAINGISYYPPSPQSAWLISCQEDVKFKNMSCVHSWIDAITRIDRYTTISGNYQDVNSWPNEVNREIPF